MAVPLVRATGWERCSSRVLWVPAVQEGEEEEQEKEEEEQESAGCGDQEVTRQRGIAMQEEEQHMKEEEERSAGCGGQDLRRMRTVEGLSGRLPHAFTGAHCCNAAPAQHLHLKSRPGHLPRGQRRHLCPDRRLGPRRHTRRQ